MTEASATTAKFPYDGLPGPQNWKKAIVALPSERVDPHAGVRFTIDRSTRVASAGSCFAQRIAENLKEYGFNYLVTEPGPMWLSAQQRDEYSYGTYSARFGNVYTTLQLLQLFERAFGMFHPQERHWQGQDGVYDPFRPRIQPGGFASVAELDEDREAHLEAVRRLFTEVEVFTFTLGLTEAWVNVADGAAYPLPPGRQYGQYVEGRYAFRNLSVAENVVYLERFLGHLARVNPTARVLLTVSPVPLAATVEEQHVLQATTYSKAVLRVAAEEIRRKFPNVEYFASYEIVTATGNNARYFLEDRRNVAPEGVDHVMWSFFRNFAGEELADMRKVAEVAAEEVFIGKPCDEEDLLRHINADMVGGQR